MSVYANLESIEASVNGEVTHTLKRPSRQIVIINDSSGANLKFKFNSSEEFATLSPTETISMKVWVKRIILLSSSSVPYRIWITG